MFWLLFFIPLSCQAQHITRNVIMRFSEGLRENSLKMMLVANVMLTNWFCLDDFIYTKLLIIFSLDRKYEECEHHY